MKKTKSINKIISVIIAILLCLSVFAVTAFAAEVADPEAAMNKMVDFVFFLIRGMGLVLLGFGIAELSAASTQHDGAGRIRGISLFISGLMVVFVKEILNLIGVTF